MAAPARIFIDAAVANEREETCVGSRSRWCDDDVEYVRADLVEQLREEARESGFNGDYQLPESKL